MILYSNNEQLIITELSCDKALNRAMALDLNKEGLIELRDNYCYLKVNNSYIHLIQPYLIESGALNKPAYFAPPKDVGAHISVIYPEEGIKVDKETAGIKHTFSILGLIKARYGVKEYFALSVISSSLTALRQQYNLHPKPIFKGQQIMFHITVGVRLL